MMAKSKNERSLDVIVKKTKREYLKIKNKQKRLKRKKKKKQVRLMKNYAKYKSHFRRQVAHILVWEHMIAEHGGEEEKMELLGLDNRI